MITREVGAFDGGIHTDKIPAASLARTMRRGCETKHEAAVQDLSASLTSRTGEKEDQMNEPLKRLRDAVAGQHREVEVDPSGQVREVSPEADRVERKRKEEGRKATKLAPRTFGS